MQRLCLKRWVPLSAVHGEVAEAERGAFLPLPESHIASFSAGVTQPSPNSTALGVTVPELEPTAPWVRFWGDRAMWIIWYIGMMASLRAMGLAPSLVPIRTDEDRKPHGDM
jgi:hypothetical protein